MRVQEREGKKMGGCKRAGLINSDNVLWDHRDKVVLSIWQAIRLRCFGGAAVRVRFCFLPMASSAPHCAAGRTKGPGARHRFVPGMPSPFLSLPRIIFQPHIAVRLMGGFGTHTSSLSNASRAGSRCYSKKNQ